MDLAKRDGALSCGVSATGLNDGKDGIVVSEGPGRRQVLSSMDSLRPGYLKIPKDVVLSVYASVLRSPN